MPIPDVLKKYWKNVLGLILSKILTYIGYWQLDNLIARFVFNEWYKIKLIGDFIWISNQNLYVLCFGAIELGTWGIFAYLWIWE